MPRLIVTQRAAEGLERCRRFLSQKHLKPHDERRKSSLQFLSLETTPAIGRPLPDSPNLRELVIPFGDSGYIALYLHDPGNDTVYLLAFRHQRELDYQVCA
ncbi:MAG TPA: type II toxin-antitoxin system RelE/ParE family toxin [Paraburkholderia sp.]|nr:type II toxin-antitoxin system RelE/ParE family toxin [Paraburkholderia sp.]